MKTLKVSNFAWNATCPKCKEHIDIGTDYELEDGDIVRCPFCNEPYKIKLVDTLGKIF